MSSSITQVKSRPPRLNITTDRFPCSSRGFGSQAMTLLPQQAPDEWGATSLQ